MLLTRSYGLRGWWQSFRLSLFSCGFFLDESAIGGMVMPAHADVVLDVPEELPSVENTPAVPHKIAHLTFFRPLRKHKKRDRQSDETKGRTCNSQQNKPKQTSINVTKG